MATKQQRDAKKIERLEAENVELRDEVERLRQYRVDDRKEQRRLEGRCDFLWHEAAAAHAALAEQRISYEIPSTERVARFGWPTVRGDVNLKAVEKNPNIELMRRH